MNRIIVADYNGKNVSNNWQSVLEAKRYFAKQYGINFDAWSCEYKPYYGDSYTAQHNGITEHFAIVF